MRKSALLAASAVMAFSCAPQAMAQEWAGWYVAAIVGTATERESSEYDPYGIDLAPSGTAYGIAGGHRFVLGDDLIVGVEASVTFGSVEASGSAESCNEDDCGFRETVDFTRKSTITGRFGGSIGHEVGGVLVSGVFGIEARNYVETFDFDADNGFDDYGVEQTTIRVGPYWGARVDWPVTDRVSVAFQWTRSEPVDSKTVWNDGFETETASTFDDLQVRLGYRF